MNVALVRCPDCGQLALDIRTSTCEVCNTPARVISRTRPGREGAQVSSVPSAPTRPTITRRIP